MIPFRGWRYDSATAGDLAKLISPPYDIIDPALRDVLFHQSKYNIARIIKADRDTAAPPGQSYAAAGRLFDAWRQKGVVRQDPEPAIYVYEQHFEVHERKFSRTGMAALVRLQELGDGILPHESTLTGPREDRLELLRATATHFGQIFGLYPDPERGVDAILNEAKQKRPLAQAADASGHLHRLWAIADPEKLAAVQSLMSDKGILIADGHHRYETALAYSRERPDLEGARFVMMTLVNMSNPGLVILPIHRLVRNLPDFDRVRFLAALRKRFEVRAYPGDSSAVREAVRGSMAARLSEGDHAFGLYLNDDNFYEVTVSDADALARIQSGSEARRRLDVTILHQLVFEDMLGIGPERVKAQSNVGYVKDFPHAIQDAVRAVASGEGQAFFLLNPARIEDVRTVAANNERMPQKSTFFYPKVYTGMVFDCIA